MHLRAFISCRFLEFSRCLGTFVHFQCQVGANSCKAGLKATAKADRTIPSETKSHGCLKDFARETTCDES